MHALTTKKLLRPVRLLFRGSVGDPGIAIGATVESGWQRVTGFRRIVGFFRVLAGSAAAAGFPRVRFSNDQVGTAEIVRTIPLDPTQPNVTYPFDLVVEGSYARAEFTNGGVLSAEFRTEVWVLPE